MTAMLGMYDLPALQPVNDRFWTAIRARLGYGPERLCRDLDFWDIWRDPDLVLAQTCGMPYRTALHGEVALVGTPDYALEGCGPGEYRSALIARRDDPRGLPELAAGTFAYNEPLSQSGWSAPVLHLAGLGIVIGARLATGAHAASAAAVATGAADLAGIDALTWDLLCEHDSALTARLRVVEHTAPTPGLPLITARTRDADAIARAVAAAMSDLSPGDRQALRLRGLVRIEPSRYHAIPSPAAP